MKLSSKSFWLINGIFGNVYAVICVISIIFCVKDENLRTFYTSNAACSGVLAILMLSYRFFQDDLHYERTVEGDVSVATDKGVLTKHLVSYPVSIFTTVAIWNAFLSSSVIDVFAEGSHAAKTLFSVSIVIPILVTIQSFIWMGTFYRKLCEHHQIQKRDLQGISFFAILLAFWSLTMLFWCLEILLEINYSHCELAYVGWFSLICVHGLDILLIFFILSMPWTKQAWYAGYVFIPMCQLLKLTFFCITTEASWRDDYDCSDDTIHVASVVIQVFSISLWGAIPFSMLIYILIRNFMTMEIFRLKIFLRRTLRRQIGRTIDDRLEKIFHDTDIERTVWRYLGNPTHEWLDLFPKYYPRCCPHLHRYCHFCCCYKKLRDLDKGWDPKYPLEVFEIDVNELYDRVSDQQFAQHYDSTKDSHHYDIFGPRSNVVE